MPSVFDISVRGDHTKRKMFLDGPVTIARNDKIKYPFLEKLTEKQLGFFWRPEEVEIYRDAKDFRALEPHEQHIFTSNLKRQILLDSVQGRAPVQVFGPICSLPELETWLTVWTFFETIHSRSYTYIIKNVYADPSKVFDEMMDIQPVVDCAKDISTTYDTIGIMLADSEEHSFKEYKEAIWKAMMGVNILEGIRFYVSFACSWAFAEVKKMEGNAKIIKFIARDENLHLAGTQQILKALVNEDADFAEIKEKTMVSVVKMYVSAVEQEKQWAKYLFKDGSIIGLNEAMLVEFIEHMAYKRMTAIGVPSPYKVKTNPLAWTQKWISGDSVQVAPQETQITSYVTGGVKNDMGTTSFGNFKL